MGLMWWDPVNSLVSVQQEELCQSLHLSGGIPGALLSTIEIWCTPALSSSNNYTGVSGGMSVTFQLGSDPRCGICPAEVMV